MFELQQAAGASSYQGIEKEGSMKQVITLPPPNSLILVMDYEIGVVPDQITSDLVTATDSCIAIGTLAAPDGETTITLTDDPNCTVVGELVFNGELCTPNKELAVCNVLNQRLLTLPLLHTTVRVKVFANDVSEPDRILVLAS
ncbi:hypothetical protein ABE488_12905 [Luteimonas sp. TWI662]|uniref:hypothetical protein n=1 Tax=Luteimonas sp. TWI662 TaxID=3136789 RepID=UPI00320B4A46